MQPVRSRFGGKSLVRRGVRGEAKSFGRSSMGQCEPLRLEVQGSRREFWEKQVSELEFWPADAARFFADIFGLDFKERGNHSVKAFSVNQGAPCRTSRPSIAMRCRA